MKKVTHVLRILTDLTHQNIEGFVFEFSMHIILIPGLAGDPTIVRWYGVHY